MNSFQEQTHSDVAVGTIWVALTASTVELNFLRKILDGLREFLHFPVNESNIGVCDRIVRIEGERLKKVSDRIFELAHIFETASSVVIENRIIFVKFDGSTELSIGLRIFLKFIVDHSLGVKDRRKLKINCYQFIKILHRIIVILLSLIEQTQMIKYISIGGIQIQCIEIINLLLVEHI